MADTHEVRRSSPALIAAAWIVVLLPAAWGLNYTVGNALKIFQSAKPAAPASSGAPVAK